MTRDGMSVRRLAPHRSAVGSPTGVSLDRKGRVVVTEHERQMLLQEPREEALPTLLLREAWRHVRGMPQTWQDGVYDDVSSSDDESLPASKKNRADARREAALLARRFIALSWYEANLKKRPKAPEADSWRDIIEKVQAAKAAESGRKPVESSDASGPRPLIRYNGPQDKAHGVIGYDTVLPVPDWAKTLLPEVKSWSDSSFPVLLENGKVLYKRGFQRCVTAECVLKLCVRTLPLLFGNVATSQMREARQEQLDAFLEDPSKNVALGLWQDHARILYKTNVDPLVLTVYDPQRQEIGMTGEWWLTTAAQKAGYSVVFEARAAEQTKEQSCQLHAAARVLMAAVHGQAAMRKLYDVAEHAHLLIFPVITHLLYTKCLPQPRWS